MHYTQGFTFLLNMGLFLLCRLFNWIFWILVEYKRARSELKKKSIETVRLQKKLRKGNSHNGGMGGSFTGTLPRNHGSGNSLGSSGSDSISLHGVNRDLNRILEVALRDNADKRQAFEDSEKHAIKTALIEERSRFALFVSYLKPVVVRKSSIISLQWLQVY